MPISGGKYVAPTWANSTTPPIDASELQDICDSIESYADPVAVVPTISNPNLLDNWYFVGGGSQQGGGQFPINQRGATAYSTAGTYTIDRWYNRQSLTASLISDGLKLEVTATSGYPYFTQRLNNYQDMLGKTVTLSCLISGTNDSLHGVQMVASSSNGVGTNSTTLGITDVITAPGLYSETFTMPDEISASHTGINIAFFFPTTNRTVGDYCVVSACKLELGSTQTLAHQENGAWVLNEIPNFDIQFARCSELPSVPGRYETGTYTGTGTSGSSNPVTLTLGFVPKYVLVTGGTSGTFCTAEFVNGATTVGTLTTTIYTLTASWSGTSLSWYYATSGSNYAWRQMNNSGTTYYYLAVG